MALFAASPGGLEAQELRAGYVAGKAVNEAGEPLAGVRIRVFGTTDGRGSGRR